MSLTKYVTGNTKVPTNEDNISLGQYLMPDKQVTGMYVNSVRVRVTMRDCSQHDIDAVIGLCVRAFGLEFDVVNDKSDGSAILAFDRADGPVW